MRTTHRIALVSMLCIAAPALAGEPAPPPQRTLLLPPVAEVPSPITDRFAVRAVYFRPTVATTIRYDDSAGNPGTRFGGARELGLDKTKNQGWIDMMIRVAPRHRVLAEYYQLTRTGDKVLGVPISFGDNDYQAGTRVLSSMDLRTLGITYLYSPLRREKVELAAGLGVHLLQVQGSMEAPTQFQRDQLDTAGPFPSLVVDGTWRITRRFSLNGTFHYLTVSTNKADGDYMSWRANLQYRGWRNLAIGAGYIGTRFKVDSTDSSFRGFLDMWYTGPEVFARVSF